MKPPRAGNRQFAALLLRLNGVGELIERRQLEIWPEQAARETQWLAASEAAVLVAEPWLANLISKIPALVRRGKLEVVFDGM